MIPSQWTDSSTRLVVVVLALASWTGIWWSGTVGKAAASGTTTISGWTYNRSTNVGIPGMQIAITNNTTGAVTKVTTNSGGLWSLTLPTQTLVSIAVASAVPSGLTGPVAVGYPWFKYTDVPNYQTMSSYPYQDVGFACHHNTVARCSSATYWLYDLDVDNSYNFGYLPAPTPAPKATPIPPPPMPATTATPTLSPTPTPRPARAPTRLPPAHILPATSVALAPASALLPTPEAFIAQAASSGANVALHWSVANDAMSLQQYKLERSIDNATWLQLELPAMGLGFVDTTTTYFTHYFYRLSSIDATGRVSAFAYADVSTGAFIENVEPSAAGRFTSNDQVASVDMPVAALSEPANCAVLEAPGLAKVFQTRTRSVVAGPYTLVCKNADGAILQSFSKPIAWRFAIRSQLDGYERPGAMTANAAGTVQEVATAAFDPESGVITFEQSSDTTTAVLAVARFKVPIWWMIAAGVVVLGIGGYTLLMVRRRQQQHYSDYIAAKYFNY